MEKCEICGLEKYFSLDVCRDCSRAVLIIGNAGTSSLDTLKALVKDGWMKIEVEENKE